MDIPPSSTLNVPFSQISGLTSPSPIIHPACIHTNSDTSPLQPSQNLPLYLAHTLLTPKLTSMQRHLWLAGLPRPARPLHRQLLLRRQILITEDPDEHLVWLETTIFIKPLPAFLLSWDFWTEHLCGPSRELHKAACGFLLSYTWLVQYHSDLKIAKELGLLPAHVEWAAWTALVRSLQTRVDVVGMDPGVVAERYQFGELRLTRLNAVYRLLNLSVRHCVRGYMSSSTWYQAFFARNFAWLLAVFAFVTVMLSAMQVGLGTTKLQSSEAFQESTYGFAVASILAVLGSVVLMFVVWAALFVFHLVSAWNYYSATSRERFLLRQNSSELPGSKENV